MTLPDGKTTPARVSWVGTVASTSSGQGNSGSTSTIPVQVKLTHPQAAGSLDQAPVTVTITTSSVKNVLAVPVGALLARSSQGYAVEVAGAGDARHLVPVRLGLFDDAAGLVQVTGALRPGQRVVVPRHEPAVPQPAPGRRRGPAAAGPGAGTGERIEAVSGVAPGAGAGKCEPDGNRRGTGRGDRPVWVREVHAAASDGHPGPADQRDCAGHRDRRGPDKAATWPRCARPGSGSFSSSSSSPSTRR